MAVNTFEGWCEKFECDYEYGHLSQRQFVNRMVKLGISREFALCVCDEIDARKTKQIGRQG